MDLCSQTKAIEKYKNKCTRRSIGYNYFPHLSWCEKCVRPVNDRPNRFSVHNASIRFEKVKNYRHFKFNKFAYKLFTFCVFISIFAPPIATSDTSRMDQVNHGTHPSNGHNSFINASTEPQSDISINKILANYTINDTTNLDENVIKSVHEHGMAGKATKSDKNKNDGSPDTDTSINVNITNFETEYCDLAFINEEDKRNANNGFMSSGNDAIRNREKRAIQKPKTIETAIFIDRHLHQRFSKDLVELKRLVMAIISEVQLIYTFRTMKTAIRIVIVRFEVLPLSSNTPDDANGDIDKYLDNFCEWQSRQVRHEPRDKRWDHAIMLTGLDLYKDAGNGKKNRKVLGLAWVNGMCKPQYSCTLNEGKSFEAAFVIAHEMGHRKGHGLCLENMATPKSDLDYTKSNRLPGEQYPPDLQCRLALGSQYKAYSSPKAPFDDICRELWCLSGSWVTPAHPALEGSVCGTNKRCIQGECGGLGNKQRLTKATETVNRRNDQIDTKSSSSRRAVIRTLRTGRNRFVAKRKRKGKSMNIASSSESKQTMNAAVSPIRTAPVTVTVAQRFNNVFKSMSDGVKTIFSGLG